jgi:Cu(I)/Ag(I) efflux system membrane fusion protein
MNRSKILLTCGAAGLIVAGGYGLYLLGIRQGMTMPAQSASVSTAAPGAAPEAKKVLYWHDPMVPTQKFDKPGKSPFMDMQLVPVYADGGADDSAVSISASVQQNLGIRTVEVVPGSLKTSVTAVGSIAYNDRDVELVQARSNGFVEKLYVRAVLDRVKQGQALAQLYVPEWVAAEEEYLSVSRMIGTPGLEALRDGARQRMRLVGMNEEQIRQVVASGKVLPRITLTAPISGIVSELQIKEGMTVMSGAPLFRINGTRTVWVNAEIPENFSAQVRPGTVVEARTPSLEGTVFTGKVSALLPEVNATTRTLKARIELANPKNELAPGMFATISFTPSEQRNVLLVPTEAVIQTGVRSVVMVASGKGQFMPVDVEIGREAGGQTEIRKGLEAGQKVVASGQFLIDSEASLRGTTTRMQAMAPANNSTNATNATSVATPNSDKQPAVATHRGQGTIEKIEADGVTISHGPIPGLQWGAMTMGFKAPATGLPKNLTVGEVVDFEIRETKDGQYEIATIGSAKSSAKSAMKGMPMPTDGTAIGAMKPGMLGDKK